MIDLNKGAENIVSLAEAQQYTDALDTIKDLCKRYVAEQVALANPWLPIETASCGKIIDTYGVFTPDKSYINEEKRLVRVTDDYISRTTPYPTQLTHFEFEGLLGRYTRTHWKPLPPTPQDGAK